MSSGLLYSLITMPMETAKNRMAFQRADPTTGMKKETIYFNIFLLFFVF